MYFRYFAIIHLPLEKKIWNPFHSRNIVPSLVEIGPVVPKKIFIVVNVFLRFIYYLPLIKERVPSFEKYNDALCHVWLKLAQWFWRRRFVSRLAKSQHYRHAGCLCYYKKGNKNLTAFKKKTSEHNLDFLINNHKVNQNQLWIFFYRKTEWFLLIICLLPYGWTGFSVR